MKFDVIEKAKKNAALGNLSIDNELHYNDSYPAVRAWNLSIEEIRRDGALFNMYRGALFSGIDIPMVLLLWPGYEASRCGLHYGCMPPGFRSGKAYSSSLRRMHCQLEWFRTLAARRRIRRYRPA